MKRTFRRGFTLVELLVVIAIIGILSMMAIINYVAALNRARQKRTVADIRSIATAWESRATEAARFNAAGFTFPAGPLAYDALSTLLVPTYTKVLPRTDAWSRPLEFAIAGNPAKEYAIRSAGRDGIYETSYTPGATNDPDCDIVYSGGSFIVYPEVVQTER